MARATPHTRNSGSAEGAAPLPAKRSRGVERRDFRETLMTHSSDPTQLKTRLNPAKTEQIATLELARFIGDQDITVQTRFVARIAILDTPLSLLATQTGVDTSDSAAFVV